MNEALTFCRKVRFTSEPQSCVLTGECKFTVSVKSKELWVQILKINGFIRNLLKNFEHNRTRANQALEYSL